MKQGDSAVEESAHVNGVAAAVYNAELAQFINRLQHHRGRGSAVSRSFLQLPWHVTDEHRAHIHFAAL